MNPLDLMSLLMSKPAQEERDILGIGKEQQALSLYGLISNEDSIIKDVAKEYGLNDEQTRLLKSIRKVENGRQGREFGVLTPEAMRYENDPNPIKSFETQARWAAGTIKKRYNGDLEEFSKRWAPIGVKNDPKNLNKNWLKNIKYYMEEK